MGLGVRDMVQSQEIGQFAFGFIDVQRAAG